MLMNGAEYDADSLAPIDSGEMSPAHPLEPNPARAGERVRGFRLGRINVRYLKSGRAQGWGHDEGDCTSRTMLSLSFIYEADRCSAFRVVAGRHSLWFFN